MLCVHSCCCVECGALYALSKDRALRAELAALHEDSLLCWLQRCENESMAAAAPLTSTAVECLKDTAAG
jgi:hypothetical protein